MNRFANEILIAVGLACSLLASVGMAADPIIGLVTKTEDNPFFVEIKDTVLHHADELGIKIYTFAGEYDGDSAKQIEAIETLVDAGVAGILISPSDPAALADAVSKARQAGVIVIAIDTLFEPTQLADATFATDNFRAGELIGMWAKAYMGSAAKNANVVTLDGAGTNVTVDLLRNQGFLSGFGVGIRDPGTMYDEDDERIVGSGATFGSEEGGRSVMQSLLQNNPQIDLVYAINEPAAAGAYAALQESKVDDDAVIVSIDGGCDGVNKVADGELNATVMQFPQRMAVYGIEAVVNFVKNGKMPDNTPGLDFFDTGVTLVTDTPVPGIPSITAQQALMHCWG
ncbi:MAG: substrate-binding domain-containing protein [Acidiferrobacterales bacterium]|nr:substrate-binding domain-containing protein [Acidiferrobacterales bacterium]